MPVQMSFCAQEAPQDHRKILVYPHSFGHGSKPNRASPADNLGRGRPFAPAQARISPKESF